MKHDYIFEKQMPDQGTISAHPEFSKDALKAGEDVLRDMEPDWFLGWPEGSHSRLVSNIVSAVCQASGIDASVQSDTDLPQSHSH